MRNSHATWRGAALAWLAAIALGPHGATAAPSFSDSFESARQIGIVTDAGETLEGWWWVPPSSPFAASAPAVVLQHGCSGVYGRDGAGATTEAAVLRLFREWAVRLNRLGVHVLLLDSFSTRSPERRQDYCNDRASVVAIGAREEADRPRDAFAAARFLRSLRLSDGGVRIDAARIGLLGWSHGGSSALAAGARDHWPEQPFAASVAFYPGCGLYGAFGQANAGRSTYVAAIPILLLLGQLDTIGTVTACGAHRAQSEQTGGAPFSMLVYESAIHSFDNARCVADAVGDDVSPWTGRRYACSGGYGGADFTLHDWYAKQQGDWQALCHLGVALGLDTAVSCPAPPPLP